MSAYTPTEEERALPSHYDDPLYAAVWKQVRSHRKTSFTEAKFTTQRILHAIRAIEPTLEKGETK